MDKRGPLADKFARLRLLLKAIGVSCKEIGVLIEPSDSSKTSSRYALVPLECPEPQPENSKAPEMSAASVGLAEVQNPSPAQSSAPDKTDSHAA